LALNGYRERPRYDCVSIGALYVPEPHIVRQVLVRDPKVLTPLFYVSKPIGRSIRVQPAIRCDAINDDRGVPKNAEEKLAILGVETDDVIVDKGLDFSRGVVSHGHPPVVPSITLPPAVWPWPPLSFMTKVAPMTLDRPGGGKRRGSIQFPDRPPFGVSPHSHFPDFQL
jgi:hypothetical protein